VAFVCIYRPILAISGSLLVSTEKYSEAQELRTKNYSDNKAAAKKSKESTNE
jgi:hypothetical protein